MESENCKHEGATKVHTHKFGEFGNKSARFLILGTFPGKQFTCPEHDNDPESWFYSTSKNTFWSLLAYALKYTDKIQTRRDKELLLKRNGFAITDIIEEAYRLKNNNSDNNLDPQSYKELKILLTRYPKIAVIFLTSKSMHRQFFIKEYVKKQTFVLKSYGSIENTIGKVKCKTPYFVYNVKETQREIKVVLLNSPAREIPPFKVKKKLYKRIIQSEIKRV